MRPTFFHIALTLLCVIFCTGADWLQFRGNNNDGIAPQSQLPVDFGKGKEEGEPDRNIAWKSALPGRGVSGPIVVAGKVIVTSVTGFKQDRLHVLCFDAQTGKQSWERQFWATGRTLCHPTSSVAAPTPASDGKLVFAFFSSNDLVCLDLEGNLKWFRGLTFDYPTAANDVGMSASPIVVGQTVIVQVENKTDSFAAGLDTSTGETRWRIDRAQEMNWTSPAVLRGKTPAEDLVLLQSTTGLTLNDPMTGKEVWAHKATCSGIPSVSSTGDLILLPAAGLTALRYKPGADSAESLWTSNQLGPGNSSPIMQDGKIYTVNRTGTLTCGDAANGETLWRVRMKGTFWASPVIAGGYLYGVSQDGICQVVRLGDKGEIVSENTLDEPVFSSPAVADDALYIRTDGSLWKIARQP